MTDKKIELTNIFETNLAKKLNESFGNFGAVPQLPVEIASFPQQQATEEPEADPTKSVVTSGETAPFGTPREDEQQKQQIDNSGDNDSMIEVANLLVTIGYILQLSGAITDKYDTPSVIDYLTKNFSVQAAPAPVADGSVVGIPQEAIISAGQSAEQQPPVVGAAEEINEQVDITNEIPYNRYAGFDQVAQNAINYCRKNNIESATFSFGGHTINVGDNSTLQELEAEYDAATGETPEDRGEQPTGQTYLQERKILEEGYRKKA